MIVTSPTQRSWTIIRLILAPTGIRESVELAAEWLGSQALGPALSGR